MKQTAMITLIILASLLHLHAQQDIASARAMGTGATVTISGIVTNGDELGMIRYMQDRSAGIAVYSTEMNGVKRGDSVTVSGTIKDYLSLLEVDPVTTVTIHSSGNTIPEPLMLTPGQFSEEYEGMLVQVDQATFKTSGAFQREVYGFTAAGENGQLYINDPNSPLIGSPIPSGPVSITGPLGSYLGSFQLLPRDENDLLSYSSIRMTEAPALSMLSKTAFSLEWSTDAEGTTEALVGLTPGLELTPLKLSGNRTSHLIEIDGLNPSELFYIQAFSVRNEDTANAALKVVITVSDSEGSIRALFNRPVDHSVSLGLMEAEYLPDQLDDELIKYIDQAGESIDLALYNLNNSGLSDITAALNSAHRRGLVVRAVYDGDVNAVGIQELDAGIGKMASPQSNYPVYGIMHNKFVVIDAESTDPSKPLVWSGSTNFTYNQIHSDPNNVIIIQDQSLARAFRLEFEEMYGSSGPLPDKDRARFGPDKLDNTPHEFLIGGTRVECYFSPSDGTHHQILKVLESSDHSIHVATMLITRQGIANTLAAESRQGEEVQVVIDDYDQHGEAVVNTLKASLGEDIRIHGESGILHHKYLIVDQELAGSDPLVLTGSHNWSESAQVRNDENTLIIHDQGLANAYYQEFVPRFSNGKLLVSDGSLATGPVDTGIKIYPNPASEWIWINAAEGSEIEIISLMDPAGRILLRFEKNIPPEIDLRPFGKGFYLLHITLSNGEILLRKFLIQ
jgi:phosphatidylserine/phosphatidylglycerophosphate/cardiolipin synthase-like enzyme